MFRLGLFNLERKDTVFNDGTSVLITPREAGVQCYKTVDIRSVEPMPSLNDYFDFSTDKWYFYSKVPSNLVLKLTKKCGGIAVNNCPALDLPN